MATAIERELDRLYQLPLAKFTTARDQLAKELRAENRREDAEEVKRLRKPQVAVWLVNRLAHERELDVQRLMKAGERLTKAQARAASGESAEGFLEARREEHNALERLAQAARGIATREQVGAAAVDRATQTLRAAALTDEGRTLLKRGRLTEELQPPGFEAFAGLSTTPAKSGRQRRSVSQNARSEALKEARGRVRELTAEERTATLSARDARREAERLETEAARARDGADDAEAEAAAAAKRRQAAEAEFERLRKNTKRS